MRVIGTAGHVDHGKSALVEALTGTHPDRLKEEKMRQMTIDLGFAWLTLPGGEAVGIVDVPGHRDFIENMLAGIGGIDAAILVIAADEGVMPQSREHLSILRLLEIPRLIVALTKIDLIEDETWTLLVEDELREMLLGTDYEDSPIVHTSAVTREGLDELKSVIDATLKGLPPRKDIGKPRLPVDRVFSIAGFGTVVTGTLTDGSLRQGEEVEIIPSRKRGRLRGLQSHKLKIETAVPGSRVAANISGVDVAELERGDMVTRPATYTPTRLIDVRFNLLSDSDFSLKHNQEAKLFIGAAQRMARIRLLASDELKPGDAGWLQLKLDQPIVAARGDRYILRKPSPSATLGGGRIADPHPSRLYKRRDKGTVLRLEALLAGKSSGVVSDTVLSRGIISVRDAMDAAGIAENEAKNAILELLEDGEVFQFDPSDQPIEGNQLIMHTQAWADLEAKASRVLDEFHASFPLRAGIPIEEFRSKLELKQRDLALVLREGERRQIFRMKDGKISAFHFDVLLNDSQQNDVSNLMQKFDASPYTPPSIKEARAYLGNDDLYNYLLNVNSLIAVSNDVVFTLTAYNEMCDWIRQALEQEGTLTVAQVRDRFGTSRKYALALMEHLDSVGVTVREGDVRRRAG
jgi:selenocysteine-specific elongation factor